MIHLNRSHNRFFSSPGKMTGRAVANSPPENWPEWKHFSNCSTFSWKPRPSNFFKYLGATLQLTDGSVFDSVSVLAPGFFFTDNLRPRFALFFAVSAEADAALDRTPPLRERLDPRPIAIAATYFHTLCVTVVSVTGGYTEPILGNTTSSICFVSVLAS
jgi:hypothetical protein